VLFFLSRVVTGRGSIAAAWPLRRQDAARTRPDEEREERRGEDEDRVEGDAARASFEDPEIMVSSLYSLCAGES